MTIQLHMINQLLKDNNYDYVHLLMFFEKNKIKFDMKITDTIKNTETILIKLDDYHIQSKLNGYIMKEPIVYTIN